jgi:predicted transcriptional regulator
VPRYTTIKTGTEADFFRRGLELARAADQGREIEPGRIISFEDPAEMMKVLTESRVTLFRRVKEAPGPL